MKTVFIDCSPKKKLSASGFIATMTSVFVRGMKKRMKLRTKIDYEGILKELENADTVVFSMPLYVDGVPSHVLPFLKEMEAWCRDSGSKLRVYVIANNGFIEGRQNEPLMQIMENFCIRSGIEWCGGLGIGGGVMMNVMRIVICVLFGIMVLNFILTGIATGNFLNTGVLLGFLNSLAEVLFFGCGIITFDIWFASCINRKKEYGKRYTRIFRGWFSKKKPG